MKFILNGIIGTIFEYFKFQFIVCFFIIIAIIHYFFAVLISTVIGSIIHINDNLLIPIVYLALIISTGKILNIITKKEILKRWHIITFIVFVTLFEVLVFMTIS